MREIAEYVATGEPMGRAGAYAIQGRAGAIRQASFRKLFGRDGIAAVRNGAVAAPFREVKWNVAVAVAVTKNVFEI